MSILNEIQHCEVCGSSTLKSVLDLGHHPMCDDLVEIGDPRVCKEYPIEILYCAVCRTAHQRYQVPKEELFPKSYHYRSRFTSDVLEGMKSLVDSCVDKYGSLKDKLVLDIGCNDGSLLEFFKETGANTVGIEPTDASKDARIKGHAIYSNYLSPDLARQVVAEHGHPSIITFTNVFAHIEDLGSVLVALKILQDSDTKIVIENHYLGAVLTGNQFDTFYHEHPRTYSFTSFRYMAQTLGVDLEAVEFPSRYGGNIRVFMGINSSTKSEALFEELNRQESSFEALFDAINENIRKWVISKSKVIKDLYEKHGKLRAKAFPGRSAILVKMLAIDEEVISAVYEKPGSMKIGHFVPGTRIPILSDEILLKNDLQCEPILNFAWHISDEIKTYLNSCEFSGLVVDLLDKEDFQ